MESGNRYTRIKEHFKNNKKTYLWCGVTAVTTAAAVIFASRSETNVTTKQFTLTGDNMATIVNITKPGNSGNVILDPNSLKTWLSQNKVAQDLGKSRAEIQRMIEAGDLLKIQDGSISQLSVG